MALLEVCYFDGSGCRGSREWKAGEHHKRSRACAREPSLPKVLYYNGVRDGLNKATPRLISVQCIKEGCDC